MRFKTKFKDYVHEVKFTGHRLDDEVILDRIWNRIMERYPNNEKSWDEIYEKVKRDFYTNYKFIVYGEIVEVKEKKWMN